MANQRAGRATTNNDEAKPRRSIRIARRQLAILESMTLYQSHDADINSASPDRHKKYVASQRTATPESTAPPTLSTARRSARIVNRHLSVLGAKVRKQHTARATNQRMGPPEPMPRLSSGGTTTHELSVAQRASRHLAGKQLRETKVVPGEIVVASSVAVVAGTATLRRGRTADRKAAVPQKVTVPLSSQTQQSSRRNSRAAAATVAPRNNRAGVSNWRPSSGIMSNRAKRKCRFCSSDPIGMVVNGWSQCDWTDGRFPVECTNCADYRTTNPNAPPGHDCDVPFIHQIYRKYAATDPVRYDRAFDRHIGEEIEQITACTECTSVGRHIGCDIDPGLALECFLCSKRKARCSLLNGPLMRHRPNLRQGVTTWFRHACDCCAVMSMDNRIPLQSQCTWLKDRSTWNMRCNRCVTEGLACLTQGMLGAIPHEILRPKDWQVHNFLELGWAELRPRTIWRRSCRHCDRDGAHCRAATAHPYSACGRCTAIGLDCVTEDGTFYPIFDISQVGFGLFLPFPACERCIETGRNCDRQRPCDSCAHAGECVLCDRIDSSSPRRGKNCIYGRLDPPPGALYYLASGYGANGVDDAKDGSKLEHWIGPFTSTYAMEGLRFRERAAVGHVLRARRNLLPAGLPPHATPGSVLATTPGSRLTGDDIADMIREMWPAARLLNSTVNLHTVQTELRKMKQELVQDPTPGDLAPANQRQLNDVAFRLQRYNALGPIQITRIVDTLAVVDRPNQAPLSSRLRPDIFNAPLYSAEFGDDLQSDNNINGGEVPWDGDDLDWYGHTQEYPEIDFNSGTSLDKTPQLCAPADASNLLCNGHGGTQYQSDKNNPYSGEIHGDAQGYPNTDYDIDPALLFYTFADSTTGHRTEAINDNNSAEAYDRVCNKTPLIPCQRQLVADTEKLSPIEVATNLTQQAPYPSGTVMNTGPVVGCPIEPVKLGIGPFQTAELQIEQNPLKTLQIQRQPNTSYAAMGRWRYLNPTHEPNLGLVHRPSRTGPETFSQTPLAFGAMLRGNSESITLESALEPASVVIDRPALLQALISVDPLIPTCFESHYTVNQQTSAVEDVKCRAPVLYMDTCTNKNHKNGPSRFLCDACDRDSASFIVQPCSNPLTAAEVVGMRWHLCNICTSTRGGSPEEMMNGSWPGVNAVYGLAYRQASNQNMSRCNGIQPNRDSVTFFDQAQPLTGCLCGMKLFKARQCRVHRIESSEALMQQVAAAKEWRIQMHQVGTCPSCMSSSCTSDAGKAKAWICLACGGWVMNQDDMPVLIDGWQAWFATIPESLRVVEDENGDQDVEMADA